MGTRTTALRERMRDALRLRNYAVSTETKYIWHVSQFAHYFGKSPEIMGELEIRRYLRHLQEERRVSNCQYRQTVAALRFLYADTLGQEWLRGRIPYPRPPKSLLQVLTVDEVQRLLTCTPNLRDLAALKILYGSGLRVMECLSLKVADINSKEMFIRVRHGKGDRERRALLSPALLTALRDYWRRYRPTDWLFPSRTSRNSHRLRDTPGRLPRRGEKSGHHQEGHAALLEARVWSAPPRARHGHLEDPGAPRTLLSANDAPLHSRHQRHVSGRGQPPRSAERGVNPWLVTLLKSLTSSPAR